MDSSSYSDMIGIYQPESWTDITLTHVVPTSALNLASKQAAHVTAADQRPT